MTHQTEPYLLSPGSFKADLRSLLHTEASPPIHILVGAGFSREAGVPLAGEVAGLLAAVKNRHQLGQDEQFTARAAIDAYLAEKLDPAEELATLQRQPEFAGRSASAVYQALFSDSEVLPGHDWGQRQFIDELITRTSSRRDGYDFEALYLAHLATLKVEGHDAFLRTILTTNFDNVLPNSFSILGSECRLIDHDSLLEDEDGDTPYPRIVYLHGRYLNYVLANTDEQIRQRREVISRFLGKLDRRSRLLVVGYSGWEDAVMRALGALLASGHFLAGVSWFHYGKDTSSLSPVVRELAQANARVKVVLGLTAIDTMRLLLEASGVAETEVIRHLSRERTRRVEKFRQRLRGLTEEDLAIARPAAMALRSTGVEPPSVAHALARASEAMRYTRQLPIAMALLNAALAPALDAGHQPALLAEARLYRARGTLRLQYRHEVDDAVIDLLFAYRLFSRVEGSAPQQSEVLLALAEAYVLLGETHRARQTLAMVRAAAGGAGLANACCDALEGRLCYKENLAGEARRLLEAAAQACGPNDPDWRTKVQLYLIALDDYLGRTQEAAQRLRQLLDLEEERPGDFWDGPLALTEARLALRRDDLASAGEALQRARRAAEVGLSFETLGRIIALEAEHAARAGRNPEADALWREAAEIDGLAKIPRRQVEHQVGLWIHRVRTATELGPELAEAARQALAKVADPAVAAVMWSRLAVAFLAARERDHALSLAAQAAAHGEAAIARLRGQVPAEGPLVASVEQRVLMARLLAEALGGELDQPRARRLYAELRTALAVVGFESGEAALLHTALALQLCRRGLLAGEEVDQAPGAPLLGASSWPAAAAEFAALAEARHFPFYRRLGDE